MEQLVVYLASYGLLKKPDVQISENEQSVSSTFHVFFLCHLNRASSNMLLEGQLPLQWSRLLPPPPSGQHLPPQ